MEPDEFRSTKKGPKKTLGSQIIVPLRNSAHRKNKIQIKILQMWCLFATPYGYRLRSCEIGMRRHPLRHSFYELFFTQHILFTSLIFYVTVN